MTRLLGLTNSEDHKEQLDRELRFLSAQILTSEPASELIKFQVKGQDLYVEQLLAGFINKLQESFNE